MKITYAIEPDVTVEEVSAVFTSSGIRRPVDDPERIAKMLRHADLIICARAEKRLIGVARSLTDFCYCCYLSDLAVAREFQKLGIGKELIRRTQQLIGPQSMLLLLEAPSARDYYGHVGFTKMENAWMLDRRQA